MFPLAIVFSLVDVNNASICRYDGERVQAHKRGTEVQVFSRSRKPVREEKLGDSLLQLLRDADTPPMILDAELVLVRARIV